MKTSVEGLRVTVTDQGLREAERLFTKLASHSAGTTAGVAYLAGSRGR